jgi:hypothetical protein
MELYGFFTTLKQSMSEMLGKITFLLLIWNLKKLGVQLETETKNEFD